jgi:hypothetical protein
VRESQLRQLLRERIGEEQLEFRIPQLFLPPRFRDLSEGRDLLLMLDDDFTVHIRWHNEIFHTHHPLTPGETRRLVGEIMRYILKYREQLRVFGTFLDEYSEAPWDDERYHDGFCQEEETTQRASEDGPKEEKEHEASGQEAEPEEVGDGLRAVIHGIDDLIQTICPPKSISAGERGESPYPNLEY